MTKHISVIIPTVQKRLSVTEVLVDSLIKDVSVQEVLIINNLPEKPLDRLLISNKVKIISAGQNMYVNPSWNLGITIINNENFGLINDDMLPCDNFCSMVVNSSIFDDSNTGLIGVCPSAINQFYDIDRIEKPIQKECFPAFLQMHNYLGTGDWGIAIFGKKRNYYMIPDDLKIIFGDNYLLYKNLQNGKKNYQIANLPFNHIHSSSSASPEFSSVVVLDCKNSKKYFGS